MPYKTNEELPDNVKSALPNEAQSIFRNAFNASISKENDEEKANKTGWGAVKNAGYNKDKDGKLVKTENTHTFDMEIFSTGTHNGDPYTKEDLDDIVKSFSELNGEIKPFIKLGHNTEQEKEILKDGQPALGWVSGLKRMGEKLVATVTDVPEIVKKAIDNKLYKRVSSEIFWGFKDMQKRTHRRVLYAIGLLGADVPAVRNLADLTAYFNQSTDMSGSFDEIKSYSFGFDENNKIKEALKMPDTEIKKYQDEANQAKEAQKTAEAARDKAEAELKKFKEDQADREKKELEARKDSRKAEIKDYCESMVKDGKISPAARDIIFGEEKRCYSESEKDFVLSFDTFKQFMEENEKLDKKEYAESRKTDRSTASGSDKFDAAVKKYMADNKVTNYADAAKAVIEVNPELAEGWVNQDEEG